MAENIITNANDVELILEKGDVRRGSSLEMGRVVVDEFSITKDEDITSQSGVGQRLPAGLSRGDIEHGFSFTMLGEDVSTFEMIANEDGESQIFSFTARKTEDDGTVRWEYSLDTCLASSEELSASSGDPMEYAVEGFAVRVDKTGTRESGQSAWD
jgi:hypothetical protein